MNNVIYAASLLSCDCEAASADSECIKFTDEELFFPTTIDPCFKMVAFDSEEQLNRAVDATIRAMEGATGMSQQADQPSVLPASAQASKPLSLWSKFDEASASDRASSTFRSPHAHVLRHEFESYLREPKIARTSSPFAGLRGVHTVSDAQGRTTSCDHVCIMYAWSF